MGIIELTVVTSACWYRDILHSQCKARDKILKIVISILSAIQQSPVNKDSLAWNLPNPKALTAWETVNVSANLEYLYLIQFFIIFFFFCKI